MLLFTSIDVVYLVCSLATRSPASVRLGYAYLPWAIFFFAAPLMFPDLDYSDRQITAACTLLLMFRLSTCWSCCAKRKMGPKAKTC